MFLHFLDDSPGHKHHDPDFALFEDLFHPHNADAKRNHNEGDKP